MARKERQPRKPKQARKRSDGPGPVARLIARIPPWAAVRSVIILLLVGFVISALLHVARYVQNHERYRIAAVELADRPPWCPVAVAEQLKRESDRFLGRSIYDRKVLSEATLTYRCNPWVRTVRHIRKRFPNALVVNLELRRPGYAVDRPGKSIVVDREGFVLLDDSRSWADTLTPLLYVWGVKSTPPVPGRRWSDQALMGGIEVLEAIGRRGDLRQRAGIIGVDVANFNGARSKNESDIMVGARNGFQIAWGRPQSTPHQGEKRDDEKLDMLERYLQVNPQPKGVVLNARYAGDGGGVLVTSDRETTR